MLKHGVVVPTLLCKYFAINDNLNDSIRNNYLWFSDPIEFNDPYDCNLNFDYHNTEQEIRYFFSNHKNHLNYSASKYSDEFIEKRIQKFINEPEELRSEISGIFFNKILPEYGICCFSEKEDLLLMWSHYAQKHQGVCLVFERGQDLDFFAENELFKVEYPDKYPQINYIRNRFDCTNAITQFVLATKSNDWSYEKEIRIIKEKEHPSKSRGAIEFNKKCLKEVIFGYKTCLNQKESLMKLIIDKNYDVTFYEMKLKQNEFGLEKKLILRKQ